MNATRDDCIDKQFAYYIKGSVEELTSEMICAPHNAKLNLRVEGVLVDAACEEFETNAYVSGGATYKNSDTASALLQKPIVFGELLSD